MEFLNSYLDIPYISKKFYKILLVNIENILLFLYFTSLIVVQIIGTSGYFFSFLVAFIFLVYALFNNKNKFINPSNIFFYTIIVLTVLVSFSLDLYNNLLYLLGIIANMLIYEFIDDIKLKKKYIVIYICILIFSSVVYSIMTHSYNTIFFRNRNSVPVLLLFILMLLEIYSYKTKIFYFFVWSFVIIFTVLSLSRAGVLALISYFILRFVKTKKSQVIVFVLLLGGLVYFYLFWHFEFFIESYDVKLFGRSIFYLSQRDILWRYALELIKKYPLGLGYKGYSEIFRLELNTEFSVHNTYLNILLQFGFPFFIAYFLFLLKLIKKCRNTKLLAVAFAVYLRAIFESGVPFGFSLNSGMLLLPFFFSEKL